MKNLVNEEDELDLILKETMGYAEEVVQSCETCEYSYPVGTELRCNYNRACHLYVSSKGRCKHWRKEEVLDMSQIPPSIPGGDGANPKDMIGPDIEPEGQMLKS